MTDPIKKVMQGVEYHLGQRVMVNNADDPMHSGKGTIIGFTRDNETGFVISLDSGKGHGATNDISYTYSGPVITSGWYVLVSEVTVLSEPDRWVLGAWYIIDDGRITQCIEIVDSQRAYLDLWPNNGVFMPIELNHYKTLVAAPTKIGKKPKELVEEKEENPKIYYCQVEFSPGGKLYSYKSKEPIAVGDVVSVYVHRKGCRGELKKTTVKGISDHDSGARNYIDAVIATSVMKVAMTSEQVKAYIDGYIQDKKDCLERTELLERVGCMERAFALSMMHPTPNLLCGAESMTIRRQSIFDIDTSQSMHRRKLSLEKAISPFKNTVELHRR